MTPPRRQKFNYFPTEPNFPAPLLLRTKHRIRFSDADPMGILWHGRYAQLFEQANEELAHTLGLTYADYERAQLRTPIVQLHVDYFTPLKLGQLAITTAKLIWTDAARINIEYQIHTEDQTLAAAGYTVQLFVDLHNTPLLAPPPLLETCRFRWRAGEFGHLI